MDSDAVSKDHVESNMSAAIASNLISCSFCFKTVLNPKANECPYCCQVLKVSLGPPCENCRRSLRTPDDFVCTNCRKPQKKKVLQKLVETARNDHFDQKVDPKVFDNHSVSTPHQESTQQLTLAQSSQVYPKIFGIQSDSTQHQESTQQMALAYQDENTQVTGLRKQKQSLGAKSDEGTTVRSFIKNRKRSASFSKETNCTKHFKSSSGHCSDGEIPDSTSPAVMSPVQQMKLDNQNEKNDCLVPGTAGPFEQVCNLISQILI